jgi:CRP/FNR family transcriptional regulator, cyclic AMP receptor protein
MHEMRIEALEQMAIFGGITEETLRFLLASARVIEMPAGGYYFREGDTAIGLYVLLEGRLAVRKRWGEHEMVLRELGPGDCFGEMALLDLRPRSASLQAVESSAAIELSADNLHRLFEHDAKQFAVIQMNIARELSRRLRLTYDLMFRATMKNERELLEEMFRMD